MPSLENADKVLQEVTNDDVAPGQMQVVIETNSLCQGKNLSLKVNIRGMEDLFSFEPISLGRAPKLVSTLNFSHNINRFTEIDNKRITL